MISELLLRNLDLNGMYKRRFEVIGLAHSGCCDWIEVGHPSPLGLSQQDARLFRRLSEDNCYGQPFRHPRSRKADHAMGSYHCHGCPTRPIIAHVPLKFRAAKSKSVKRAFQDPIAQLLNDHRRVIGFS
jgi:hypothetical protein